MHKDLSRSRNIGMRVLSFVTGMSVTVSGFCVSNLGAAEQISLQAPQSGNTMLDYEFEDDSLIVARELPEPGSDLEGYTFLLSGEPESDFNFDGSYYYVNGEDVRLRSIPDANSDTLAVLPDESRVLRVSSSGNWALVRTEDGTEGYCFSSLLIDVASATPTPTPSPTPSPTPLPTSTPKPTATPAPSSPSSSSASSSSSYTETAYSATVYTTSTLNARRGPGTQYESIRRLSPGTEVTVVAQTSNGWYKSDSGFYISSSYTTTTAPGSSSSETSAAATPTPVPSVSHDTSLPFPDYVKTFLGIPYVYGQSSATAADCSGLVKYVYANYYHISLPHGANSMLRYGTEISTSDVQCGDLVFFDYNYDGRVDHVGIYIGNNTVIHASESKGKTISSSFSAMSYALYCARRVL